MSRRDGDDGNAVLKQVLELAIGVAYVFIEFYTTRPSELQLLKMRIALATKRVCQSRADAWQKRAHDAATYYNRNRSVT